MSTISNSQRLQDWAGKSGLGSGAVSTLNDNQMWKASVELGLPITTVVSTVKALSTSGFSGPAPRRDAQPPPLPAAARVPQRDVFNTALAGMTEATSPAHVLDTKVEELFDDVVRRTGLYEVPSDEFDRPALKALSAKVHQMAQADPKFATWLQSYDGLVKQETQAPDMVGRNFLRELNISGLRTEGDRDLLTAYANVVSANRGPNGGNLKVWEHAFGQLTQARQSNPEVKALLDQAVKTYLDGLAKPADLSLLNASFCDALRALVPTGG